MIKKHDQIWNKQKKNAKKAFGRGRQSGAKTTTNIQEEYKKKKVGKYQKHDQILKKTTMKKKAKKDLASGEGNRGQKSKIKTIRSRREEQIYTLKGYNWDIRKYQEQK